MNINIIPDDSMQRIHVSQGDIGRTLQFVLYEGSTSYTIPTGATVKIQGVKPSGLGFSETCTWSGSTVTIDTTEAMTQEFGGIPTELQITNGDDVLGTSNFLLIVERNPHPDNTTDGTQDTIASLEVRIEALESAISGGGITDDIKQALLDCFEHVAWINADGQDYYDALEDALYPPAELSSISCVYTQSGTVYTTDTLDSLKSDLVVTAQWADNTTSTVTTYTLSGTLTTGTSTITVSYGGKTTTFNVTVTSADTPLYDWNFKSSMTDSVGGITATASGATQGSSGVSFIGSTDYVTLGEVFGFDKTMIVKLGTCVRNTSTWTDASTAGSNGIILWVNSQISFGFGWNKTYQSFGFYSNGYSTNGSSVTNASGWKQFPDFDGTDDLSGATLKFAITSNGVMHVYVNGTEYKPVDKNTTNERWIGFLNESSCNYVTLGSNTSNYPAFRDMVIESVKIYDGVI